MEFIKFLAFLSLTLNLVNSSAYNQIPTQLPISNHQTHPTFVSPYGNNDHEHPHESQDSQDLPFNQDNQDTEDSQDCEQNQDYQDNSEDYQIQDYQENNEDYQDSSEDNQENQESYSLDHTSGPPGSAYPPIYTPDYNTPEMTIHTTVPTHTSLQTTSYTPSRTPGPVPTYPPVYTTSRSPVPTHTTMRTTSFTPSYPPETPVPTHTTLQTTSYTPPRTPGPVPSYPPIYITPQTHVPTHTTTPRPYNPYQSEHSSTLAHPTQTHRYPLYCYSCNENQAACSIPTLNLDRLNTEHYVPCNGQCMQYQNQWDNYKWYRGCSWEMDFGNRVFSARQPDVLEHKGNVFYFCHTNGCNIKDIKTIKPSTNAVHTPTASTGGYYKKAMKLNGPPPRKEEASLYCFACNENLPACSIPTLNMPTLLTNYLIPCHGQCIQYQNQFDNNKWYRGCSTSKDFGNGNMRQSPVLVHKGTTYFFCETFGCNLNIGNIGSSQYYGTK